MGSRRQSYVLLFLPHFQLSDYNLFSLCQTQWKNQQCYCNLFFQSKYYLDLRRPIVTPASCAWREVHFRINECSCGPSYGSACEITSLKCHYHNIDRVIYSTANPPHHNGGLVTYSKLVTTLSSPGLHSEPGDRHQVDYLLQRSSRAYPRNLANVSGIIMKKTQWLSDHL